MVLENLPRGYRCSMLCQLEGIVLLSEEATGLLEIGAAFKFTCEGELQIVDRSFDRHG